MEAGGRCAVLHYAWNGFGRGHRREAFELPPMVKCPVLIAKPQISVSTKFVYDNLKLGSDMVHPDIDRLVAVYQRERLYEKLQRYMGKCLRDT